MAEDREILVAVIRARRKEVNESADVAHDREDREAELFWDGWYEALGWVEQIMNGES